MTSTTATPTTGVVITGGASGIGRATAHAVAAVGRPVAIWDVNGDAAEDAAKEVAGEHAVASIGIGLDVSEHRRFGDAIASSRDTMGSIGGLVHAAGITGVSPVDSLDDLRDYGELRQLQQRERRKLDPARSGTTLHELTTLDTRWQRLRELARERVVSALERDPTALGKVLVQGS